MASPKYYKVSDQQLARSGVVDKLVKIDDDYWPVIDPFPSNYPIKPELIGIGLCLNFAFDRSPERSVHKGDLVTKEWNFSVPRISIIRIQNILYKTMGRTSETQKDMIRPLLKSGKILNNPKKFPTRDEVAAEHLTYQDLAKEVLDKKKTTTKQKGNQMKSGKYHSPSDSRLTDATMPNDGKLDVSKIYKNNSSRKD